MPESAPELRPVVVLFCDLKGFTRLSESRAPDEIREMIDDLFGRLRRRIESLGGTVDKIVGDAIMAVFGAPVAHEDDPLRAVRCAREMQAEVREFAREEAIELAMRIGIHSGEAAWGRIAGEKETVMGDAVNVAKRLEETCAPGRVLVSSAVEEATRDRFTFLSRGPLALKGRAETVEAYEVEGEREVSISEAAASPMVGRRSELNRLLALRGARPPAAVWIHGEAGIGKSRLVAEFAPSAGRMVLGDCLSEDPTPFGPIGRMVRSRVREWRPEAVLSALDEDLRRAGVDDAIDRENCAQWVALAAGMDLPDARVLQVPPERAKPERHRALRRWLESFDVAVIEDAHWADPETMELLSGLARQGPPCMLLVTSRPGTAPPPGFETLSLSGLPRNQVAELSASLLGEPAAPSLVDLLHEHSSGNPLFLEALVRHLQAGGALEGKPLRLRGALDLPDSLHRLLLARLDRLPLEERQTLQAASVFGRSFWARPVEEILGRPISGELASLERKGIVGPRSRSLLPGEIEFFFVQALLRDAAYATLPRRRRAGWHAAAARSIGQRADSAEGFAMAARHWEEAGRADDASRAWETAAQRALSRAAYDSALAYANRAGDAASALLLRGKTLTFLARYPEALSCFQEALRQLPEGTEACRALASIASLHARTGRAADALRAAEEAEKRREDREAMLARVDALLARGQAEMMLGNTARALERAREALDILQGLPESDRRVPSTRARALRFLGAVNFFLDSYPAALDALRRAAEENRALGNAQEEAAVLLAMANVNLRTGASDEALARSREALEMLKKIGDRAEQAACLTAMANVFVRRSRAAEAEQAYREALAIHLEIGNALGVANAWGCIGNLKLGSGDPQAAAECQQKALAGHRELGNPRGEATARNNLGFALFRMGDLGRAAEAFEQSLQIARALQDRGLEAAGLNNLGMILALRWEFPEAETQIREAMAIRESIGDRCGAAYSLGAMAALRIAQGRYEEAEIDAKRSLALRRELEDRTGIVESLCLLARIAAGRERAENARRLLDEAEKERGSPPDPWASLAISLARAEALDDGDSAREALRLADEMKLREERIRAAAALARAGRDLDLLEPHRRESETASHEARSRFLLAEAEIHLSRGDRDRARAVAEKVRDLSKARGADPMFRRAGSLLR